MALNKTLLILVFSLSYVLVNTDAIRTPEARVWTICKPTTNPLLCYKTILPEVINIRFNMYKALEIEILAAQSQVKNTSSVITALLAKPGNSKGLSDSLRECQDQYGNMLDSIKDAIEQVTLRNAAEARFKFSAVMSYRSSCDDQFTGPSPIAIEAQRMYDLGGNCLDIMKAIEDRDARRSKRGGATPVTTPVTTPTPAGPCQGVIGTCG